MARKKAANLKRFQHEGGYLAFPRRVFRSPAFQKLSPVARCILMEFQDICTPDRNGKLVMSQDKLASRIGVTTRTISKECKILQEAGFLEISESSAWRKGKARVWRLTYQPTAYREPTDEWLM